MGGLRPGGSGGSLSGPRCLLTDAVGFLPAEAQEVAEPAPAEAIGGPGEGALGSLGAPTPRPSAAPPLRPRPPPLLPSYAWDGVVTWALTVPRDNDNLCIAWKALAKQPGSCGDLSPKSVPGGDTFEECRSLCLGVCSQRKQLARWAEWLS